MSFKFLKANGLNNNSSSQEIVKIYLGYGLLQEEFDALGLDNAQRLESLVFEWQRAWGSAVRCTYAVQTKTNEATGEHSNDAETYKISIYGKNVTDTSIIDGKTMARAVKNMSVLVVSVMEEWQPGTIKDEEEKRQHEYVLVAMVVEAIWALQEDIPSRFRDALLSKSLRKVYVYSEVGQFGGESME
jgi:hypothetical protein